MPTERFPRGDDPVERLRAICLALPEATEQETWGHPTFRVRDKIFAACGDSDEAGLSMTCKAPAGAQEVLVASDPERFFRPAYVGHRGWIGVRLDGPVDWDQIDDLVEESYRMTAPKRLAARLTSR
ncbi:MAG TPA: MmcQ/YjbR family DNA-binding protein [Thermoanaerobaculia bacterium]|nr:MmcQ/YjbR family DNA-binding protein [Thermoanaerobaculia bacterium]